MTRWTGIDFKRTMHGKWLVRASGSDETGISGVSTDSRTIDKGEAFIAIRGERFDGHEFIADALERRASLVVADRADLVRKSMRRSNRDAPALLVRDSVQALGAFAASHRRSLNDVHAISVCGSNGKTTTVRLLECVLASAMRGTVSPKSFNNEIGLPLTVTRATLDDQFLVCEAGCNAPGEIARLGPIAQPDTAIITSIGRAHMENFESVDDVAREDASMFAHLRPGGTAIIPAGHPVLEDHSKPVPHVVRIGSGPRADVRLESVEHLPLGGGRFGLSAKVKGGPELRPPLIGRHNALNALFVLAAARRLGMSDDQVARAMLEAEPADLRLQQRRVGSIEVLVDCYNANPESMAGAVRTFAELTSEPARRVLILGDMLELGEMGPEAHREIGRAIAEHCEARMVVTIGPLALMIAEEVAKANPSATFSMHPELTVDRADRIAAEIREDDQVLLKGSRGVRLERVLLALERRVMREERLTAA